MMKIVYLQEMYKTDIHVPSGLLLEGIPKCLDEPIDAGQFFRINIIPVSLLHVSIIYWHQPK